MNGKIKLLLIYVLNFVIVKSESRKLIKPEIEEYDDFKSMKFFGNGINTARQVDSTVFKTLNKYYCSLDSIIEGSHLILYGNKGWTFPVQDVNLTLRYPSADEEVGETFNFNIQKYVNHVSDDEDYLVSGFKVILLIDGPETEGYIIDGGVLQDSITLSFIGSQITSLEYEFWLYGVRKDTPGVVELNSHYRLC